MKKRKRIDSLTEEEKAMMGPWADKFIEAGLSTEADWPLFNKSVADCYRFAGLEPPRVIVRCPSPLVVVTAGPIAARIIGGGAVYRAAEDAVNGAVYSAVDGAVHRAVGGAVRGAVGDAVGGAVHDAVGGAVRGAVSDAVRGAVSDAVRGAVSDAVRGAVHGAVSGAVYDAVGNAVSDAVSDAVHRAVEDAVGGVVEDDVDGAWHKYVGGRYWLSWVAWKGFYKEIGLDLPGDIWARHEAYKGANMAAGWWWPHRRFVMVSEPHKFVHLEQVGPRGWGSHRLHCEDGPAIAWDGFELHFVHGVRVPKWLVETAAEDLDPALFAKQQNVEVRREFVRKVGIERICNKLGTKVLDRRGDYELHLVPLGGETGEWPYLKMKNPSIGVYHMEAVSRDCRTVEQALNFRNGGPMTHLAPIT